MKTIIDIRSLLAEFEPSHQRLAQQFVAAEFVSPLRAHIPDATEFTLSGAFRDPLLEATNAPSFTHNPRGHVEVLDEVMEDVAEVRRSAGTQLFSGEYFEPRTFDIDVALSDEDESELARLSALIWKLKHKLGRLETVEAITLVAPDAEFVDFALVGIVGTVTRIVRTTGDVVLGSDLDSINAHVMATGEDLIAFGTGEFGTGEYRVVLAEVPV